jgi:hypothetical protein
VAVKIVRNVDKYTHAARIEVRAQDANYPMLRVVTGFYYYHYM